jgi:hypothetical protein
MNDATRNSQASPTEDAMSYNNARDKFDASLDIKEIAKRLRKEIKAMQKMGLYAGMKVSVRIERYSGGQSLSVTIKSWDGELLNPAWIAADPDYRYEVDKWTPRVCKALEVLKRLANQWNYNNSDSQVDYFDVNYYTHVSVDWELARDARIAEEAKLAVA